MPSMKEGDVVQLKSGGPQMIVNKSKRDKVQCSWFDPEKNKMQSSWFDASLLKVSRAEQ